MTREEGDKPDTVLSVDHGLVSVLEAVEQAASRYLDDLSESALLKLRDALGAVDEYTATSDRWSQSAASSAAWGYGDIHLAIGQTGMPPVIDHEGAGLFRAQIALVQAAKDVVARADPITVEKLRSAALAIEQIGQ